MAREETKFFSVEDFRNGVAKTGLTKGNKYVLRVKLPPLLTGVGDITEIFLRIDSVELPGKQLATSEVKYYGPPRKSPYGMVYEDLNCTLLLSANLRERYIFSQWMNAIYNYDTAHISYFKDFTSELEFDAYSDNGLQIYTVVFEECYPISIGSLNFAYGNEDLIRLPLTFSYRKWKENQPMQLNGGISAYADLPAAKSYPSSLEFNQSFKNMLNSAVGDSPIGQIGGALGGIAGLDLKLDNIAKNFTNSPFGRTVGDFSENLTQGFSQFSNGFNQVNTAFGQAQSQLSNVQNRLNQFNPAAIQNQVRTKANNFVSKKLGGLFKF